MGKGRAAILITSAVVFLTAGFVLGQMVQAVGTIPGSADDPLVAKSYVEEAVGKQVASLQTSIAELQAKVTTLEAQLAGKNSTTEEPTQPVEDTPDATVTPPADTTPTVTADGQKVTVTAASANVRSGPGTTYDKVITILKGDEGTLLGEENGWYRVKFGDGQEGWVANWLVQVEVKVD